MWSILFSNNTSAAVITNIIDLGERTNSTTISVKASFTLPNRSFILSGEYPAIGSLALNKSIIPSAFSISSLSIFPAALVNLSPLYSLNENTALRSRQKLNVLGVASVVASIGSDISPLRIFFILARLSSRNFFVASSYPQ